MNQRNAARFQLTLPLLITRIGAEPVLLRGQTINVSSCAVHVTVFTAEPALEPDSRIHFVMSLPGDGPEAVNLHCMGRVLHLEPSSHDGGGYDIQTTLERYEFTRSNRESSIAPIFRPSISLSATSALLS
jgi:hypothetical protein